MFSNKKYHRAIQLFIDKLRKNNITCDIKVFDEIDYYTIFLLDEKSSELGIIDRISYKVDAKFDNALCKSIHCEYLYDWFKDDDEIKKSIKEGKVKDITECFSVNIPHSQSIIINNRSYTLNILDLILSMNEIKPAFEDTVKMSYTSDSKVKYGDNEIEVEKDGFAIAA